MKKSLIVGSVVLALGFSASACNSDSKSDSGGGSATATPTAAQGNGQNNGAPSTAPTSKTPGGGAAQGKNDTEIDAKLRACLKSKGYNNLPKETIRSIPIKGVKDSDVMACMS